MNDLIQSKLSLYESVDEGFWDKIKGAAQGAVKGWKGNQQQQQTQPPAQASQSNDISQKANKNKQDAMAEIAKLLGIKASKVADLLASTALNDQTKQQISAFFKDYDEINKVSQTITQKTGGQQAAPGAQPPVISQQQDATYKKIQDLAAKFTKDFSTAFKKLAGKNQKLLSYADELSSVTLKEMMANPAQGMKDKEAAAAQAKKPQKAKVSNTKPKDQSQGKKKQPQQPQEPQQQPQQQEPSNADYKQLTKIFTDFLTNVGQALQIKGTARDIVKQLQQSQAISDEQKGKLTTFLKVHLKIITTLGKKIAAKEPAKPEAKPQKQPEPQPQQQQQGQEKQGGDYSIEESQYKSYFKTLLK